jgi:hypothetical protein
MNLDKQYSKVIRKGDVRGKFYYKIQHRDIIYAKKQNYFPSTNIEFKSDFLTAQERDEGNWKLI